MPLAPEIAEFLSMLRDLPAELRESDAMPIEQGRELHDASVDFLTPVEQRGTVASVQDASVSGPGGPVGIRIYRPVQAEPGPVPTLMWMHGGSWSSGSLKTADVESRALCEGAGVVVVSVDYRLAPEHLFPAGLDDCGAVLRWIPANIGLLGGDAARIAVGGESAGATFAAVLGQNTTGHDVPLAAQMLVCPATDLSAATDDFPSRRAYERGYLFETADIETAARRYLAPGTDRTDPRISPLHGKDLAAVPPMLLVTVEFDPLHDEAVAYGRKVADSGVRVVHRDIEGLVHGSLGMIGVSPTARAGLATAAAALAELLGVHGTIPPAATQGGAFLAHSERPGPAAAIAQLLREAGRPAIEP
ncbi:alpha/beta hydrolase [Uniformispora flossi]|uniref:alpha/beta hydrolase n=1 Tax=Uniformispora flossi TaxID=3390723 RepID=UPI003C2B52D6